MFFCYFWSGKCCQQFHLSQDKPDHLISFLKNSAKDFPGSSVVKISPSNAGNACSIWGSKIPDAWWPKNIKQKQYCNKFNKDFKNGPHTHKKKLKKALSNSLIPIRYSLRMGHSLHVSVCLSTLPHFCPLIILLHGNPSICLVSVCFHALSYLSTFARVILSVISSGEFLIVLWNSVQTLPLF